MNILNLDTPHWLISAYVLILGQFSATGNKRVHN
jgi:hypothetical protein